MNFIRLSQDISSITPKKIQEDHEAELQRKEEYRKRVIESYVADPVDEYGLVDDPVEHDSWVVLLIQWEFTYWICLGVSIGIYAMVGVYCIITPQVKNPQLYSTDALRKLFFTPYYWNNIFAQLGVVLVLIFYALFTLSQAKKANCFRSIFRWVIFLLIEVYILAVFITQCSNAPLMRNEIERAMRKEANNRTSILRTMTQSYMHCCGIEEPYSWHNTSGFQMCNSEDWCGYPQSCCNTRENKPCFLPVSEKILLNGQVLQGIWRHGCLYSEILYADLFAFVILYTNGFILVSSIIMILLMYIISYHAVKHRVEIRNEFYSR